MPKYRNFEELPVWQEAARLYHAVVDLVQTADQPLSSGTRHQLDRAALSVSNNIAEGFERTTTAELIQFIGFARGSAGEVRSMMAVLCSHPRFRSVSPELARIRTLAESCARQLSGWREAIEGGRVQGKRHLTPEGKAWREAAERAAEFRRNFLRNLKPEHPLYHSSEARSARGEPDEGDGTNSK